MDKTKLIAYLDKILDIANFQDDSKNGLQVDCTNKEITKIAYAVDAVDYIFDQAIEANVDMLLVHHGMFRGFDQVLTWNFYHKIKKLIDHNIAIYASHLPLDAHIEFGNNAVLKQQWTDFFGITKYQTFPFGRHGNRDIACAIRYPKTIPTNKLSKFCQEINLEYRFYNFGNKQSIRSVVFSSGGGGFGVSAAQKVGYDLLITWEAAHHQIIQAKELWQSILLGWHYETEVFGVKKISQHLQDKFGVDIVFLDEKYNLEN